MAAIGSERVRQRRRKRFEANVRVRCTPEEHRTILANARQAGRSASRFLVELGTRAPGQLLAPAPAPEEIGVLEDLLFQLHRLGVNLNQLVHLRHLAEERGGEPETDGVDELLRAVQGLLARLRERLR